MVEGLGVVSGISTYDQQKALLQPTNESLQARRCIKIQSKKPWSALHSPKRRRGGGGLKQNLIENYCSH